MFFLFSTIQTSSTLMATVPMKPETHDACYYQVLHRVLQDDSLYMQKFGYLPGHGWNMRVILSYQTLAQQHFQYQNSAENVVKDEMKCSKFNI